MMRLLLAGALTAAALALPAAAAGALGAEAGDGRLRRTEARPFPTPTTSRPTPTGTWPGQGGRAKKLHKLLMIDLGGNWCADCRLLTATMEQAWEPKAFVEKHYVVVLVDVGPLRPEPADPGALRHHHQAGGRARPC